MVLYTQGYLTISKSKRKSPEYYAEFAKRGIVKRGPVKYRPNVGSRYRFVNTETGLCNCWVCRALGDYRLKITRVKNCLDFYMTVIRDCDLLDIRPDELTWICRDCVCHDKCSGVLEDLVTKCKCKKCKHFLDLGETEK